MSDSQPHPHENSDEELSNIPYDISINSIDISLNLQNEQINANANNISANDTSANKNILQPDFRIPDIIEDLSENIIMIDDNELLLTQIKNCALQIKCENFHGKGSIEDYNNLFIAAAEIANQTKTIELDVNVDGFNEFAAAADDLSNLFKGFTEKLKNVNIIDDSKFLTSILNALQKIVNLSNNFATFKQTILATSTFEIPTSIYKSALIISQVSDEVDCAMQYINNFVIPDSTLQNAALSSADKLIIEKATTTINSWNSIVEHGVSVTMAENSNMQYIKEQNTNYFERATVLRSTTINLRNKFNLYNL